MFLNRTRSPAMFRRKILRRSALYSLACAAISVTALTAQAQRPDRPNRPQGPGTPPSGAPAAPGAPAPQTPPAKPNTPKPYKDVVTAEAKSDPGLFTVHRQETTIRLSVTPAAKCRGSHPVAGLRSVRQSPKFWGRSINRYPHFSVSLLMPDIPLMGRRDTRDFLVWLMRHFGHLALHATI